MNASALKDLLAGMAVCVLVGCGSGWDGPALAPPSEPSLTVQDLLQVQGRIDVAHPGRGVTDYPGNTVEDVPKSYAMVLLAELQRKRHRGTDGFRNLEAAAGQWLLDHADENRDGVVGWGVPVAWDAYGDNSINPAHTEYSISTGIAIDALLSWREVVAGPKAAEILAVVERAAAPYVSPQAWSPAGMLPYSLRESDRRYDTFNSAVYLAGQLQRLAQLTSDAALADKLRATADSTVAALLRNKRTSPETGAWYWHYSIQEATANDLPHAAYIAVGLADYVRHRGHLGGQVQLGAVFKHLQEFLPEPPRAKGAPRPFIRAWPRFKKEITREARSCDLGMALHLACTEESLKPMRRALFDALSDYRTATGEYQKYPVRSDHPPLVVAEYESYLYRGVASCLVATAPTGHVRAEALVQRPVATPALGAEVMRALAPQRLSGEIGVPFVDLPGGKVLYTPATMTARLLQADGRVIGMPQPGVPVAVVGEDTQQAVFLRTIPAGELLLVPVAGGKPLAIRHAPDREPMFRAATVHEGALFLVYYDNATLHNWLLRLEHGPSGWQAAGAPVKLPLLEDPAGGTYEMIPRVEFVAAGGKLWLTGGTLKSVVDAKGGVQEGRFRNCVRSVEVVAGAEGPVALCAGKDIGGPAWLLAGAARTELDVQRGLPWNLRIQDGAPVVDYAATPQELAALLHRDLHRSQQGGWLEFGTNNDEGRIPWSQVYYLNGFLDMIALARADDTAARVFLPLLPSVRQRLDLEMALIDAHWRAGRYSTRAFTVDRSPALFAVQTGRLLLLMDRYAREVPDALPLACHADVRCAVTTLRGHIEVLARSGEDPKWLAAGRAHLRWPKGSKFAFDGLNVPFNHQNEWAYAVLRAGAPDVATRAAAQEMIRFFADQIAPAGALPSAGTWSYWWGKAYEGWTEGEGISANKPSYGGDKIKAWISFRTIDAMALASTYGALPAPDRDRMVESVATLVRDGQIYPFAGYELLRLHMLVLPSTQVAQAYARVSSPWELQSAAWALARLAQRGVAG